MIRAFTAIGGASAGAAAAGVVTARGAGGVTAADCRGWRGRTGRMGGIPCTPVEGAGALCGACTGAAATTAGCGAGACATGAGAGALEVAVGAGKLYCGRVCHHTYPT